MYRKEYSGVNIYPDNSLYFSHISKTGGTFLLRNFLKQHTKKNGRIKDTADKKGFTMIRNPYKWYLSLYNYSKNQNFKNLPPIFTDTTDIEMFMKTLLNPYIIDINILKNHKDPFYNSFLPFIIKNCKLDIGYYTLEYIWRTCYDYNILVTSKTLDELEENIKKKNSIKYWLKTSTLDQELPIFLKEHFNITFSKNCNKYSTNYNNEVLNDEIKELIKKKEIIIFNRHFNSLTNQ